MASILAYAVGATIVIYVMQAAVRMVILPRASRTTISTMVIGFVEVTFKWAANRRKRYEDQDSILAGIAPVALILIPAVWISLVLVAGAFMFWGTDPSMGWRGAFHLSGSSITTLGFAPATGAGQQAIAFVEAMLGLLLLTLLITYLPTIYAGFQRREQKVALMEVRAGNPPSADVMLRRFQTIGWLETMTDEWLVWEQWFVELDESHTTHAALPWFRSTDPAKSWVTAAGTAVDAASIYVSAIEGLSTQERAAASLTIRSGFLALRRLASTLDLPFDSDPEPSDPISIQRQEFDDALDHLAEAGVPITEDRDQAWVDFAGWRVNYDNALLGLAQKLRVPYAPWSSDRYPLEQARRGMALKRR